MKRRQFIFLASVAGLLLSISLWLMLTSPQPTQAAPAGIIRYVLKDGGLDVGDCTDEDNPCLTIQYGINQSSDGDTIRVGYRYSALSYYETIHIQKSINLEGGWHVFGTPGDFLWTRSDPCNPAKTIIDASGSGRPVTIDTPAVNPKIECFTIKGGNSVLGANGGGIYSYKVNPIILNNYIIDNVAASTDPGYYARGGGIYIEIADSTSVISGNLIEGNWANNFKDGLGGGIFLYEADTQVIANTIQNNQAGKENGDGGGIYVLRGSPTIMNNNILQNKAGETWIASGGGIYAHGSSASPNDAIIIQGNTIQSNQALAGAGVLGIGGGIYINGFPNMTITDNDISDNAATLIGDAGKGGGIMVGESGTNTLITDNHISENYGAFNNTGYGGGIYAVELFAGTIQNNIIESNYASWAGPRGAGGGLYIDWADLVVNSNVISGNFGTGFFGFPSAAEGWGGGIYITNSHTTIMDNLIYGNTGTNGTYFGVGGGIYAFTSTISLISNTIAYNNAGMGDFNIGGGAYIEMTGLTMERNQILHNQVTGTAYTRGGGVRINNCSAFTLTNNIVAGNQSTTYGSGVDVILSQGSMYHNTIAENSGGKGEGVLVDKSTVALANTILVSQTVGISVTAGSNATMEATLWGDGAWANGIDWGGAGTLLTGTINLWEDPQFIHPANDDYHILNTSPAIDAGIDIGITQDIDGETRPQNSRFDIGADEVFRMLYMYLPILYH